jgi:hypothetical protein
MSVSGQRNHRAQGRSRQAVCERILSDFCDFRFSWRGFFKWSGATLLGVLAGAVFALSFVDWNQMRGPVGHWLSSRTGREVRFDGELSVKLFTLQPSL